MAQQRRKIIPAPPKVDVTFQYSGTLYPVEDYKPGAIHSLIVSFRQAISSVNPFAHQQVPSSDRVALAPRWGSTWNRPDIYPNGVVFENGAPSHYDPLKDLRRKNTTMRQHSYATGRSLPGFYRFPLPRGCVRQVSFYQRCLRANNESKELCQHQANNIMNICPSWALNQMKNNKISNLKQQRVDTITYKSAMEVSPYNQGRTIANVPNKSWIDGAGDRLRPDTLWADERYVDITQREIDAAKIRVAERQAKKHYPKQHEHVYDWQHASYKHEKPLYP